MARLLEMGRRRGEVIHEVTAVPDLQTQIEVAVPMELPITVEPVSLSVRVEQTVDGVNWFTFGGGLISDVRAFLASRDKAGALRTQAWLRVTEQVVRQDVFAAHNWASAHELRSETAHYHHLALTTRMRFRIQAFHPTPEGAIRDWADLTYALDAEIRRTDAPAVPIGRRSASLLGTFTAAENAGGAATSGSRTTTSGSLIIGQGGAWDNVAAPTQAITDSAANSYTEDIENSVSSGAGSFGMVVLSHNIGGTRGASHTVTNTRTSGNGVTAGGLEFDGVEASPTVVVGTVATGTSTAPSCSVSPGAASLVVGIMGYDGTPTTFAANVGTLGIEVDENNDLQANGSLYTVAATGATTTSWTLAASRAWVARSVSFTESGGAATAWGPLVGLKNNRLVQVAS